MLVVLISNAIPRGRTQARWARDHGQSHRRGHAVSRAAAINSFTTDTAVRGKGRDSALGVGEVCPQASVVGFELEDDGDACEVEPFGEELADAAESVEVVMAVAAGACRGAVGFEEV